MLDLTDARWSDLEGGYRVPYDPRPALAKLESGHDVPQAWDELWGELHHQGDVGTASYAAVPHLVRVHRARGVPDWNTFGLVGCIERARHARNPEIPSWLKEGYDSAWQGIVPLALADLARSQDPSLVQATISVIAMARGLRGVGEFVLDLNEDELAEVIAKYHEPTAVAPDRVGSEDRRTSRSAPAVSTRAGASSVLRVIRWAALAPLLLLAVRGVCELPGDALGWIASDELHHVTQGEGWTAFERCIDYRFIADTDTSLYLARSVEDKSTWVRLAPTDTDLRGPMEWKGPKLLRIPAAYQDGCLRSVDDIVIEWSAR